MQHCLLDCEFCIPSKCGVVKNCKLSANFVFDLKVLENSFVLAWKALEFCVIKFWKILVNSFVISVGTLAVVVALLYNAPGTTECSSTNNGKHCATKT